MKIALGLNFYNAYDGLKRLCDSIPVGFIDYVIGIDGVYRYTKEKHPELSLVSNDGSQKILLDQADKNKFCTILMEYPNVTEFEKRNKYLEICQDMNIDILIIVDSDEYFIYPEGTDPTTAFTQFKINLQKTIYAYNFEHNNEHNVFGIRTLDIDNNYDAYRPRIWANPGQMRYIYGSHYHYANVERESEDIENFKNNRICYVQCCPKVVKGIILAHDHNMIKSGTQEIRNEYIEYLKKFESLTQSHNYSLDECHRLAAEGKDYQDILMENTTIVT